ncbi:MAG: hypothetical protein AAF567_09095 [Actinomycetota bacterium]
MTMPIEQQLRSYFRDLDQTSEPVDFALPDVSVATDSDAGSNGKALPMNETSTRLPHLRWWPLAAAAVILLIVGILVIAGGDGDETGVDIVGEPAVTPTPVPPTPVPEPTPEPTPTSEPNPVASATWAEYIELVGREQAVQCALTQSWERTVALYFDDDQVSLYVGAATLEDFTYEVDRDLGLAYLDAFEDRIALDIAAIADPQRFAPTEDEVEIFEINETFFANTAAAVAEVRAGIGDEDTTIDLAPTLVAQTVEPFRESSTCTLTPQGAMRSAIDQAFTNFASDAERFGGRGNAAALRCSSLAVLALVLDDVIENGADSSFVDLIQDAVDLSMAHWLDRDADQDMVDLADRLQAVLIDGVPTPAQIAELESVRDELDAYRTSLPEDGELCPLDDGWVAE